MSRSLPFDIPVPDTEPMPFEIPGGGTVDLPPDATAVFNAMSKAEMDGDTERAATALAWLREHEAEAINKIKPE